MKSLTDEEAERLGKALAEILELKKNRDGYYLTAWGTKTDQGLGRTIYRIVQEES